MGKLFTTGWYDRVEALLARAGAGASVANLLFEAFSSLGLLLANRVENIAAGVVVGQTVSLSAPPVSASPSVPGVFGPPGSFLVSATLNALSSSVADEISFQITRDGTPIGPAPTLTTDANKLATCTLSWSDESAGAGPFVYAMLATNITGAHTVATNGAASSSIVVQEEL